MPSPRPIYLFSDFGWAGPYVGQMVAAIQRADARIPVVNLMHDAPAMRPRHAAYLLAAVARYLPDDAVVVAVVDPGVGSERLPLMVEAEGRCLIGPDNGLLSRIGRLRGARVIDWQPEALSNTFHGRDLFAPAGARVALGETPGSHAITLDALIGAGWPADLAEIVYVDAYGNLMLGVRAETLPENSRLRAGASSIRHARTFSDVAPGELFWYQNSQGLVEIAANRSHAARRLGLAIGDPILLD